MHATWLIALLFILCEGQHVNVTDYTLNILRNELVSKDNYERRSLADIWNSIKITANRAWESIKEISSNAKKKIEDWIQKMQNKAEDLGREFEKLLNKIKDRVNDMIKNVNVAGDAIKKCLQERKQEIDEILKNILLDVTNCISDSLTHLNKLAVDHRRYEPVLDKTTFLKDIKDKLNECLNNVDPNNADECLYSVRKSLYDNVLITEDVILQNQTETRSATGELLATIITCTSDGIINASSIIANETIQIIECVSQG